MDYGRDERQPEPKVNPDKTGEQGTRVDYPRRTLSNEEYAAEFAAVRDRKIQASALNRQETQSEEAGSSAAGTGAEAGQIAGVAAIVLGVLALFMWTIVLGPVAAILGYYAYSQDKRTIGAWGMALGLIATLSYFVLIPFVR
ncbi:DUF5353 domain-containing protein [Paenibacillus pinistramenti]|uniref:DUF5353 domain-containing protein n=1 Tax=Paenibacillus pinistramenti TaxID=1768003 RepID=UPI001EEF8320|nr:DUF5353 domain-containing protein [Paenibacillus pinistramenti]